VLSIVLMYRCTPAHNRLDFSFLNIVLPQLSSLQMHPSLRLSVHRPLIHFVGKRQWPSHPEASRPHPFAPAELKDGFSDFVKKISASTRSNGASSNQQKSTSSSPTFEEFWHAPVRLWKHDIQEAEIEAIMSGGASVH